MEERDFSTNGLGVIWSSSILFEQKNKPWLKTISYTKSISKWNAESIIKHKNIDLKIIEYFCDLGLSKEFLDFIIIG